MTADDPGTSGRHFRRSRSGGHRASVPLAIEIPLLDSDTGTASGDRLLSAATMMVGALLWVFGPMVLIVGLLPASAVNALTGRNGPLPPSQRATILAAAALVGGAGALLARRIHHTRHWAKLPRSGTLYVGEDRLVVHHPGVLDAELTLTWNDIRAIAFDNGAHHDEGLNWRRFPLPATDAARRRYLFATDGEPRPDFALLSTRPTAPNVAIVLERSVILRNPHAHAASVAFPPTPSAGAPTRPPGEATEVNGVLLRVEDPGQARSALLPSGRVRSLRATDLSDP